MSGALESAQFFIMSGILFVRRFSAIGLTAGLIAGNAAVALLYFLQVNVAGVNIGLVAQLVNFAVTIAVSAATKNPSPTIPVAASGHHTNREPERSSA